MDDSTGTEVTHWFNGRPARRLASYVRLMQDALRASVAEAEQALWLPLMDEYYTSLLVLHPVRPVEPIADYTFKLTAEYPDRRTGILQRRPPATVNLARSGRPLLVPERRPVVPWAADDLAAFWLNRDAATAPMDRPPGLPEGAFLGVMEVDAHRLWPELFLHQAVDREVLATSLELPLALKSRKPGDPWSSAQQTDLVAYVDARLAADGRLKAGVLYEEIGGAIRCGASNVKQQVGNGRKGAKRLAQKGRVIRAA